MGNYIEACCTADTRLEDHLVSSNNYLTYIDLNSGYP
jgi:hypothetical protein